MSGGGYLFHAQPSPLLSSHLVTSTYPGVEVGDLPNMRKYFLALRLEFSSNASLTRVFHQLKIQEASLEANYLSSYLYRRESSGENFPAEQTLWRFSKANFERNLATIPGLFPLPRNKILATGSGSLKIHFQNIASVTKVKYRIAGSKVSKYFRIFGVSLRPKSVANQVWILPPLIGICVPTLSWYSASCSAQPLGR